MSALTACMHCLHAQQLRNSGSSLSSATLPSTAHNSVANPTCAAPMDITTLPCVLPNGHCLPPPAHTQSDFFSGQAAQMPYLYHTATCEYSLEHAQATVTHAMHCTTQLHPLGAIQNIQSLLRCKSACLQASCSSNYMQMYPTSPRALNRT